LENHLGDASGGAEAALDLRRAEAFGEHVRAGVLIDEVPEYRV
jgi:hypothetical protein